MKITIRKIAELTGVSRGTVDKVIHNRPGVSDDVRMLVQNKINELGYVPVQHTSLKNGSEKKYTIAVIIPRPSNPFFKKVKDGMDAARLYYHDKNVHVLYRYCGGSSVSEVLKIVHELLEQPINGIILRGMQSRRLRECINELTDRGIPIVLYDSDVPGARRFCMVGEDSCTSGRVAASLLAKSIGEQGEVAVMGGLPDVVTHQTRLQGFTEVMRTRYPNIQIVEVIDSNDRSVIAYEKTGKLLQKYPNLRGIFNVVGCTEDIGLSLIERHRDDVHIVCYNFTDDVIALVKRGIVSFAIGLAPYQQGMIAVRTLLDYLINDTTPAASFVETPILIGVDENIDVLAHNNSI